VFGETLFFSGVVHTADLEEVLVHNLSEHPIGQEAIHTVHDFVLNLGYRTQRSPVRDRHQSFEELPYDRSSGVPQVVVYFGEVRNDVRSEPPVRDHVVDPGLLRRGFAEKVGHVVHRRHAIEEACE
jgi:hypothetical protein